MDGRLGKPEVGRLARFFSQLILEKLLVEERISDVNTRNCDTTCGINGTNFGKRILAPTILRNMGVHPWTGQTAGPGMAICRASLLLIK
jgi:hypothetical protein